jgi:hypothetical protein
MHYRNGREAKPGDRAVNLETGTGGILYDLTSGDTCNGRLTPPNPNAEYVTIGNCLHLDDIRAFGVPAKNDVPEPTR